MNIKMKVLTKRELQEFRERVILLNQKLLLPIISKYDQEERDLDIIERDLIMARVDLSKRFLIKSQVYLIKDVK